ncbi:MAG: hypothetical protein RJA07_921 [Bacteroidota bacterium]|jgi:hypothetical protein
MAYFIVLLLLIFFLAYSGVFTDSTIVVSHWHHYFNKVQFSTELFYKSVEKALHERQVIATVKMIKRSEGNLFSANRIYLRIISGEDTFDLCAAPYGTGYFVSWWLVHRHGFLEKIVRKSVNVNAIMDSKTFYQMDAQIAFKTCVHNCIQEVLDDIMTTKGVRGLTELEREIKGKSW